MMDDRGAATTGAGVSHTVVWGIEIERGDFLKLPRVIARLGQYDERMGKELQPRHILLLLSLASRQFRDEPIRAKWRDLARDLGVRPDTVRRWAYELRDLSLMRFKQVNGEKRNTFDLSGFKRLIGRAFDRRLLEREENAWAPREEKAKRLATEQVP